MAGVKIFTRALTAAEVAALADPASGGGGGGPSGVPTDTDRYTYDLASRPLTAESERYANTVTFT